ncbi:MAG: MFS transporter [Myxococcales bacterium FL481]|nr:MAG: MFS transporter [Myxococcales bacterium FL481]
MPPSATTRRIADARRGRACRQVTGSRDAESAPAAADPGAAPRGPDPPPSAEQIAPTTVVARSHANLPATGPADRPRGAARRTRVRPRIAVAGADSGVARIVAPSGSRRPHPASPVLARSAGSSQLARHRREPARLLPCLRMASPTPRRQWRRFAPILAVQFIGTLGYSIVLPFLVFLVADFGGASWTYGFVGAAYSACQLVGAPVLGRWSDRLGRRPILLLSQAGTMLAWLVFLTALALPAESVGTFAGASMTIPLLLVFVARALDGVTGGNISVANAYVADLTRDDQAARQVAFGRMGMAASLGFALGPAVGGVLGATSWGYAGPVSAALVISAVATAMCLALREPPGRCPLGPPSQPAVTRILGQQHRRCDRSIPAARPSVLKRPIVAALITATFVQFLAFNLFYAGFPVHADIALHWDATHMGSFFAVMSGVMIVAQGPGLRVVSARLPPPAVFGLGMMALVAAFVAFSFPQPGALYSGAVLFAVGNGLAWPTFQARLADVAGEADQGTVQGAATSAGSFASILGLVVGGMLYPWLDVWLFVAGAILFVLVALGTPAWFRTTSSPPSDSPSNTPSIDER